MKSQKTPLVSIILPTYGRAHYLKDIIGRLLAQTYENFEILIADDYSPDNTKQVIEEFAFDGRVKYIKRVKNLGPYLNFYMTLCCDAIGELAFWHSDDDYIIDDNWLKESVGIMLKNPSVAMTHSGYAFFYEDTNERKEVILDVLPITDANAFIERFSPNDHMLHTFVFDRVTTKKYINDNINWKQTNYMHPLEPIFMGIREKNVAYINKVTMHYRIHQEQQSKRETTRSLLDFTPTAIQTLKLYDVLNANFKRLGEWANKNIATFFENSYNGLIDSYTINEDEYIKKCISLLKRDNRIKIIYGAGMLGASVVKKCNEESISFDYIADDNRGLIKDFETKTLEEVLRQINVPKVIVIATLSQVGALKMLQNVLLSNLFLKEYDDFILPDRLR